MRISLSLSLVFNPKSVRERWLSAMICDIINGESVLVGQPLQVSEPPRLETQNGMAVVRTGKVEQRLEL